MKTLSIAALVGLALLAPATANAQQKHGPPSGPHPYYCPPGTAWGRTCVLWGTARWTGGPFRGRRCVRWRWRCLVQPR